MILIEHEKKIIFSLLFIDSTASSHDSFFCNFFVPTRFITRKFLGFIKGFLGQYFPVVHNLIVFYMTLDHSRQKLKICIVPHEIKPFEIAKQF